MGRVDSGSMQGVSRPCPEVVFVECGATGCDRRTSLVAPERSTVDALELAEEGWTVSGAEGLGQFICPACSREPRVVLMSWGDKGPPYVKVRCLNAGTGCPRTTSLRLLARTPVRNFGVPRTWMATAEGRDGITEVLAVCPRCWEETLRAVNCGGAEEEEPTPLGVLRPNRTVTAWKVRSSPSRP